MANNSNETPKIERSYIDNYAIKEYTKDVLVPKYFPDINPSLRTVGMIGMTTELISNVAEDGFNATSVLFRETFPNRAEIPESIYSHAAVFQLSDIFSSASECLFMLVMEEEEIIKNMVLDEDSGIFYFYINKDLTIYVEDIPYVLDYDIRIRCVKKITDEGEDYIFGATYVLDEYNNSISNITDPYIKIRRSNNGYIALEIKMHQCVRNIIYESIITNSKINLPTIDIPFNGQLVGFDVLYKSSEDDTYKTQLKKLLIYSQPVTTPFCYYQLYDNNVLRLTFNSKDTYFIPKFNSELKIILYISEGEKANFDVYNGTNISITCDTTEQEYDSSFTMAAKVLSASTGGADRLSLDALQDLTVESYRTALALTTEPDLGYFFSNYKHRYGDYYIKFIKRRNDVYERIFGGYLIMKRGETIYKTNTLDIDLNLSDMRNPENNVFMIEPGTLFTYRSPDDHDDIYVTFYRDSTKHEKYLKEYNELLENNDPYLNYINGSTDPKQIPEYLNRPVSFSEFCKRKGYDDKVHVFDMTVDELEKLDDPTKNKFMFINPFLIRFKKSPNLVSLYMTYINQKAMFDFTNQNNDAFVQFVTYQMEISRYFTKEKKYLLTTHISSSITVDNEHPIIAMTGHTSSGLPIWNINNRYTVDKNDLRVILVIHDAERPVCYTEMYPVDIIDGNSIIVYQSDILTDDHITSDGRLRLLDETIYREKKDNENTEYTGNYYKVYDNDATLYSKFNERNEEIESGINVDDITSMISSGKIEKYTKIINMTGNDDILIPLEDVTCKIYTIYKRMYDDELGRLIEITDDKLTNNLFAQYDDTYNKYIWTNEYSTASDPITFIKPLNNVRSNLYFEDFLLKDSESDQFIHDIMDIRMESVPFVKWNLSYDEDNLNYFMSSFMSQYENIEAIINERLRNETSIDVKFYNTYGKSVNYFIGDDGEPLDMINLHIKFDMWFVPGTDLVNAVPEVKRFIKREIENVNEYGTNQLHVSNLMRKIEQNFSYVDHIRFRGINAYSPYYQSVRLRYTDLNDMEKDERRKYIPELLVADLENITINDIYADDFVQ